MLEEIKHKSRWLAITLLVGFVGLSAGCASGPTWDDKQRGVLEQRVRERWHALVARDFEKAWEYCSPAYRARFSKQLYVKKFSYGVKWELTGVEIVNYDGAAAVASVVVRVMSEPTKQTSSASVAIGAIPTTLRERWIFAEGRWWFSANY
jgi:hypothetical protein